MKTIFKPPPTPLPKLLMGSDMKSSTNYDSHEHKDPDMNTMTLDSDDPSRLFLGGNMLPSDMEWVHCCCYT